MSTIYHKHHIVPRHMGGSDDPSNLVDLTVEEHAEAHRKLFEQHGKEEDKIAWMALSGQASKPESMRMASKLGRAKTDKILEERYGPDWRKIHAKKASVLGGKRTKELYDNDEQFRKNMLAAQRMGVIAALDDSARTKRKQSFAKSNHQQGTKNSNYGKIWIFNPEFRINKTHPNNIPIPDGWQRGRKMNW